MNKIKFGTDGWRAIIGDDYTVENVARVSVAVAKFLHVRYENPSVVIGHDCRFAGKLFADTAAKVLVLNNIKVILANNFVTTPMVSLAVVQRNASLGVVITASHNPPSYNGYKLKGDFGGPLLPNDVEIVESLIPVKCNLDFSSVNIEDFILKKNIEVVDLEATYFEHAKACFDLDLINNSKLNFAYDAMYGAGRNIISSLLPSAKLLHCNNNPGFNGVAPEPIHRNLKEFSQLIKNSDIDCGLATDGDADRIGLYDSEGNFVDAHHIILLLIHYLVKYKNWNGKIVTAFSCSVKVAQMCEYYNLSHEIVKIGFKHIAGKMITEDVLLGGEESGGIATKGHIPERDGLWMGMILFEFMAKSGKKLKDLINEVYKIVGSFAFERIDLHLDNIKKLKIIDNCKNNHYQNFGKYKVQRVETVDGYKFFFDDNKWLMIRPSGTEPVLRTYSEAETQEIALDILKSTQDTILK